MKTENELTKIWDSIGMGTYADMELKNQPRRVVDDSTEHVMVIPTLSGPESYARKPGEPWRPL